MKVYKLFVLFIVIFLSKRIVLCEFNIDEEIKEISCHFAFGTQICDCLFAEETQTLRFLVGTSNELQIQNCKNVYIPKNSMSRLESIRAVKFQNIDNLLMDEFSLNLTRTRHSFDVHFLNITTSNIPSNLIRGNLRNLKFEKSHIENIQSFAFTGLRRKVQQITFNNSQIEQIETMSFRKISVEDLLILKSKFNLASKTFYDCDIKNIEIHDSHFQSVKPSSFSLKEVSKLSVINNTFDLVEGEIFVMNVSESVVIRDNKFNEMHNIAFATIAIDDKVYRTQTKTLKFDFTNNHIESIIPDEDIKILRDFNLQIQQLYIDKSYSCDDINNIYEYSFPKTHAYHIFLKSYDSDNYETLYVWHHIKCIDREKWFWILLIVLGVLVFLVLMTIFIWIYCWKCRSKRKLTYVVPEPKTYRETVIVTQIENHGLLRTDF